MLACGGSSAPTAPTDAGPADAVTDSTTGGDAGTTEAGAPITAPDDHLDVGRLPGVQVCVGDTTGLAINRTPAPTELLVYFEGGAPCHDAAAAGAPPPPPTTSRGTTRRRFQGAKQLSYPALVRSTPGSPFTA